MINQRINGYILNKIYNIQQRVKEYLSMENSLGHVIETANNSYFISIGINEIKDGIKNSKRFRITILHLIYITISTLILIIFSSLNYLHKFLMNDILPKHFMLVFVVVANGFIWFLAMKIDMLFGEINFNLSPLKVFYYLINNLKSKHKLTDLNYNRMAILSRIIVNLILDYCPPIVCASVTLISFLVAVFSQKVIWIMFAIQLIPSVIMACFIFSCWVCFVFILISYYKMRFDQIHSSIKSIVLNGKFNVINKRREKQLINLIEEHKSVSNEIHKLNLMFRLSAGVMTMVLSINRIISLYVLINFHNNIVVNVMLSALLFIIIIFGFGLTYLFSIQIKSAHQSDKLIYLLLYRFEMRLRFKFKVN